MKRAVTAAVVVVLAGLTVAAPVHAATAPNRIKATATGLYDTVTKAPFLPRGANFVRLTQDGDSAPGVGYHSAFEPGRYSGEEAQSVLDGLHFASGYNTVRVFIDTGDGHFRHGLDVAPLADDGLNQLYMANVADFVNRAATDGIYVLPAMSAFPVSPYYMNIMSTTDHGQAPNGGGNNLWFMDPGAIAAKKAYLANFVHDLDQRVGDNRSAVLAYQLENEAFWEADQAPFATKSGTFTGPDGRSYDMSNPDQRQQAADNSMNFWADAGVAGVHQSDPDAMTTVGFFTNYAVGKPGYDGFANTSGWYPGRPSSVADHTGVDFIDLHAYPDNTTDRLASILGSDEVDKISKPYLLGEFGTLKTVYGNNITAAAYGMRDRQIESCTVRDKVGNGAVGWLFWTYDTDVVNPDLSSMGLFYSLADNGGAINGTLATVVRDNPCQ